MYMHMYMYMYVCIYIYIYKRTEASFVIREHIFFGGGHLVVTVIRNESTHYECS